MNSNKNVHNKLTVSTVVEPGFTRKNQCHSFFTKKSMCDDKEFALLQRLLKKNTFSARLRAFVLKLNQEAFGQWVDHIQSFRAMYAGE